MFHDDHERRRRARWLGVIAIGAVIAWFPLTDSAQAAPTPSRLAGDDRYETAAEISEASFTSPVPVAYVATGENFPDALAGAPAAAELGGPILLTQPDAIPQPIKSELDRLDPAKIVVLGGTAAVSTAVEDALEDYTEGAVERIAGDDRYDTAAKVSEATFAPGVDTVYVATGLDFPDALAGGPAVAKAGDGGPVLLVRQGSIPGPTAAELGRLEAQRVVVLGGTAAVSDDVLEALDPFSVEPVERRAGADRYLTAVEVSKGAFADGEPDTVYLATGANFPDALAGGAPAGIAGAPVLLTRTQCLPEEVAAEIERLDPTSIVALGGLQAVSNDALFGIVCDPSVTSTTSPLSACLAEEEACLGDVCGGLGGIIPPEVCESA